MSRSKCFNANCEKLISQPFVHIRLMGTDNFKSKVTKNRKTRQFDLTRPRRLGRVQIDKLALKCQGRPVGQKMAHNFSVQVVKRVPTSANFASMQLGQFQFFRLLVRHVNRAATLDKTPNLKLETRTQHLRRICWPIINKDKATNIHRPTGRRRCALVSE